MILWKKISSCWLMFIVRFFRWLYSLRYNIQVKGTEHIDPKNLPKPGGMLFLPNHTTWLVEPGSLQLYLTFRFLVREVIVETAYYLNPITFYLMWILNAIPIPKFRAKADPSNRAKSDQVLGKVVEGLKNGEYFVLYASGGLKLTNKKKIGGKSGALQFRGAGACLQNDAFFLLNDSNMLKICKGKCVI